MSWSCQLQAQKQPRINLAAQIAFRAGVAAVRETSRPTIPLHAREDQLDAADLNALGSQLYAIARRLRSVQTGTDHPEPELVDHIDLLPNSGSPYNDDAGHAPVNLAGRHLEFAMLAKNAYALRRERDTIFDNSEIFGEPAWDILLDLYVAFVEDKRVSVSSACIGSAAPSTTGLRWLRVLAEEGLIVREHDPDDQRRVMVRLSEAGIKAMDAYFIRATSKSSRVAGS